MTTQKKRPNYIGHWQDFMEPAWSYPDSDELMDEGAAIGKKLGLTRIGIHYQIIKPGHRNAWPHAESNEDEFFFVLKGNPQVWIDGEVYDLSPGESVAFPCGTGISHVIINNSSQDVHMLVIGEASKADNQVYYPCHPHRRDQMKPGRWWDDKPSTKMGPHDGMPDALRMKKAG